MDAIESRVVVAFVVFMVVTTAFACVRAIWARLRGDPRQPHGDDADVEYLDDALRGSTRTGHIRRFRR